MSSKGWIAVDLDGTLARYDGWKGADHIGAPIPAMVERVKQWLAEGKTVKIFTARVYCPPEPATDSTRYLEYEARFREAVKACDLVRAFCLEHIGQALEVTCTKDFGMIELWDDRAVQVVPNYGVSLDVARARLVTNIVRQHFGDDKTALEILADLESGKVSPIDTIHRAMTLHAHLAKHSNPLIPCQFEEPHAYTN